MYHTIQSVTSSADVRDSIRIEVSIFSLLAVSILLNYNSASFLRNVGLLKARSSARSVVRFWRPSIILLVEIEVVVLCDIVGWTMQQM